MPDAIYIAGPTASGKSAAAILVAEALNGEIISVDSMQVYRGMDIGTAKPSREERARVPHHLIDVAEPTEPFDAARFRELATQAESDIRARGGLPIYCGGTGLYFNAVISGLGAAPAANPQLREELKATPLPALLDELAKSDPEAFAQIDRANPRRVIRALEVIRTSGRTYTTQRADWSAPPRKSSGLWIGLERDRADLHHRINARVEMMFAGGLVNETRRLLDSGLEQNRTATQAIGYRQVVEHLRGERDLPATIELVKQKTRQYAKRQMTWFRHKLDVKWLPGAANTSANEFATQIIKRARS